MAAALLGAQKDAGGALKMMMINTCYKVLSVCQAQTTLFNCHNNP